MCSPLCCLYRLPICCLFSPPICCLSNPLFVVCVDYLFVVRIVRLFVVFDVDVVTLFIRCHCNHYFVLLPLYVTFFVDSVTTISLAAVVARFVSEVLLTLTVFCFI